MTKQFFSKALILPTLLLSFFGSGFFPKAPGTIGSLATIPLLLLLPQVELYAILVMTVIVTILSCFLTEYYQNNFNLHDPQWVVIDEVLGMVVAWLFVYPAVDIESLLLVFVTFRFFDILKFWPASYFDKQMKHGAGVILDDLVSGVFAGIATVALQKFLMPLINNILF